MNDEDLEALLRRYRPLGPPAELRARLVAAAAGPPRPSSFVAEWLPVAAALMVTLLFYMLGATERDLIAARFTPVPPIDQPLIVVMEEPEQ